ncbi:nucleotide sugar dehydrogenase, partial [bacterium]|nr:nucleotide sugar dehydrogenase [bacterium]
LIEKGQSHINEPGLQAILAKKIGERFTVTTNIRQAAAQSDVALIIVPTTVDRMKKPEYVAVERVCKDVGLAIRKGCLVIVESTVGPGITETVVGKILEQNSGLKAGTDFGLAYSPIRAMAGRVMTDMQIYPKIVGGVNSVSLDVAASVFAIIAKAGVIKVKDLKTAEAVKLFENVYRDVNIALATELALFCEKVGLDFMSVREAAVTQPYCHLHVPRVGVGGHCIPYNPYFLIAEAEAVEVDLRLIKYARKVNDFMPLHIVDMVIKGLKSCGKKVKHCKIAVLGISYRNDVKESVNAPPLEIIEVLSRKGAKVNVYDPFFSSVELDGMGLSASESLEGAIRDADCVLIATGHEQFKYLKVAEIARLVKKPACIVDGWRLFNAKEVKANNLEYYGVGFG